MTCLSIIGLSPQKLNVLCLPLSHVIDFLSACYDSLKSCGTFEVRCVRSLQNGLLDRDGSPLTKSDGRNRKGTFEERFVKITMEGRKLALFLLLVQFLELPLLLTAKAKPWLGSGCSNNLPAGQWCTRWHQKFDFACPHGSSIRQWRSVHRNCKEDRVHYFGCGLAPYYYQKSDCATTNYYLNDYDEPLQFRCNYNGFITGVSSVFSGGPKDRRFKFRCCHDCRHRAHSCKTTPWQNNWDGKVDFHVPRHYYLVGVYSVHGNRVEDRRWKFHICKFVEGPCLRK